MDATDPTVMRPGNSGRAVFREYPSHFPSRTPVRALATIKRHGYSQSEDAVAVPKLHGANFQACYHVSQCTEGLWAIESETREKFPPRPAVRCSPFPAFITGAGARSCIQTKHFTIMST